MARKKKSSKAVNATILAIVLFLVVGGGVAFLIHIKSNQIAGLPVFPVNDYLEGTGLWSNEEYQVIGRVDNVLLRSDNDPRLLISIQPEGSDRRLPIVIELDEKKKSPQREQKIIVKVHLSTGKKIVGTDYHTP